MHIKTAKLPTLRALAVLLVAISWQSAHPSGAMQSSAPLSATQKPRSLPQPLALGRLFHTLAQRKIIDEFKREHIPGAEVAEPIAAIAAIPEPPLKKPLTREHQVSVGVISRKGKVIHRW